MISNFYVLGFCSFFDFHNFLTDKNYTVFFVTAYIFHPSEYTAHTSPCLLLRHAVATSAPANEGALHHDGCSVHSVLLHPHLQPAQEGDLHRQTRQQGSSEDHAGWHRW